MTRVLCIRLSFLATHGVGIAMPRTCATAAVVLPSTTIPGAYYVHGGTPQQYSCLAAGITQKDACCIAVVVTACRMYVS